MDNVPYDEWCDFLVDKLKSLGVDQGSLICDLGCGTGEVTKRLSEAGYDMIGVDNSSEMLEIAQEKTKEDVMYLLQDMSEIELYGTVKAFVSVCDSINYLTDKRDLLQTFKKVANYLDEGGIFIFDVNSPFKYEELLSDNTFAENREEVSFIWENEYDRKSKKNYYDLTLFVKSTDGLFRKYEETHVQRAYSIEEIKEMLTKAHLELIGVFDGYSNKKSGKESDRLLFIAREIRHEGKLYI